MTSISPTLTRKQTFPRVPNAYSFPRTSPNAWLERSPDPEYRSRTPSPLENSVTAEYGEGVRTVAAPAAVIPPTIGTPSITSAEDAKSPNGVIFPPMVGNVEDNRYSTPPVASTACSILLCIHSAQMRTAKNYRVAVFRSHPNMENTTDKELFLEFKRTYNVELRSFWQRFFSLRGLKYIGVIEYTQPESPALLQLDAASRNSILHAFNKPHKISTTNDWVDWIFRIKGLSPNRYGLEFVQGWDGRKIVILAAVPWIGSVITAFLWSALTGDVQTAMAVASYILTASGGILALLGIISTLEG
ncbi:uncharacterized protein H6S33_006981 [Morchella sextelata]|uniref:uncharacterized protein n=1 Tax=Morchella sextelata TaxID=1174677 RepID=UPI001D052786|nr:uncharacterized protein H6S33_006981 [Morchella sextelata]KAH0603950.1 hypothetical protein H6S33_006981 [Morchella sextelata]